MNEKLDYEKEEERKQNMVLQKKIQHLHISCQSLTHENKMQKHGILKEIRNIRPKVKIDTCDSPLIEK